MFFVSEIITLLLHKIRIISYLADDLSVLKQGLVVRSLLFHVLKLYINYAKCSLYKKRHLHYYEGSRFLRNYSKFL